MRERERERERENKSEICYGCVLWHILLIQIH